MELQVGEHCRHRECHRLDFLPLKCPSCRDLFCGDHWKAEAHHCRALNRHELEERRVGRVAQMVQCPLCSEELAIHHIPVDRLISDHLDRACQGSTSTEREKLARGKALGRVCAGKGCAVKTGLGGLQCPRCGKMTCPKHRLSPHHACLPHVENKTRGSWLEQGKAGYARFVNGVPRTTEPQQQQQAGPTKLPWTNPLPMSWDKTEKRKRQERVSTIKALEFRQEKGILSKEDAERLGRLKEDTPPETCSVH